jgi:hypothetical protein
MDYVPRAALPLCVLAFAACSSAPFTPPHTDGGALPDASSSPMDASHASDLATTMDAAPPTVDMAWTPAVPHPPMDATLCAHGTFAPADSQKVCMTPSWVLDEWGMAMQPFPRDCGAVAFDSGDYQVFCDQTSAYLFVHYANLRPTGTLLCKGQTPLYLSAVYAVGNGGGDTGDNVQDGYGTVPEGFFDVNMPVEAYTWITVGVMEKAATIWLAPENGFVDPQCAMTNTGGRTIVGGATITWGM